MSRLDLMAAGGVSAHSLGRDGWAQPGAQGPLLAGGEWRPELRSQLFLTHLCMHMTPGKQSHWGSLMSCARDQCRDRPGPAGKEGSNPGVVF